MLLKEQQKVAPYDKMDTEVRSQIHAGAEDQSEREWHISQ